MIEKHGYLAQAHSIVDRSKAEGRELSTEECDRIDDLVREANRCQTEWNEAPQKRQTRDPALEYNGYSSPSPPRGLLGNDGGSVADRLFGQQRQTDGFASFGEWLQCLDSGRFDQRLRAAASEGIDSDGGFLVPSQFANMFLDAAIEETILVKRCLKLPMTSDELKVSGFDGNNHTSTLFGGIIAAWEEELATASPQTPKTRQVAFHAHKLLLLTRASNELLADASSYERMLGRALITATAWKLDYDLFRGTGAGQPLGALSAGSRIEVAKVANQTADTIWFRNLVDMFARLHPNCYKNAIWCINPTCIVPLLTMDVHVDVAGSASLVGDTTYTPFRESDGRFTLFGRPVEISEKLPGLGNAGDIVLVDPTQYALAMRQEVVVEKSVHAGFTSDSSYYRCKLRGDGSPLWAEAMTPNAGDSLSWCVTLAERS